MDSRAISAGAALRASLDGPLLRLILAAREHPGLSAAGLLALPGVRANLQIALDSGGRVAASLLAGAWEDGGGDPFSSVLAALKADLERMTGEFPGQLEGMLAEGLAPVHEDWAEVTTRVAGAAVDRLMVRARLTVGVAPSFSRTQAVLAEGRRRQAAGEKVMKSWRSKLRPRTCRWCRLLHGTMIPLEEEFPHGDPVALPQQRTRRVATPAGARRYDRAIGQPVIFTFPPGVWGGRLEGPPRHPECECELVLVTLTDEPMPGPDRGPEPSASYVHAADIAALPEARYQALRAFLRAATHELGQILGRLRGL